VPQAQAAEIAPPPLPPVAVAESAPAPLPYVNVPAKHAKVVAKAEKAARAPSPGKPARVQTAAANRSHSNAVVQLGAYGTPKSVLVAWNAAAHRYRSLQQYSPMSARFASAKGTFYRLSVKGFGSVNEAEALCSSLRRAGGSCFVRNFAGDAPVEMASR
jgi:cell division septation protein DedD